MNANRYARRERAVADTVVGSDRKIFDWPYIDSAQDLKERNGVAVAVRFDETLGAEECLVAGVGSIEFSNTASQREAAADPLLVDEVHVFGGHEPPNGAGAGDVLLELSQLLRALNSGA